jgi:hypothetical protein
MGWSSSKFSPFSLHLAIHTDFEKTAAAEHRRLVNSG